MDAVVVFLDVGVRGVIKCWIEENIRVQELDEEGLGSPLSNTYSMNTLFDGLLFLNNLLNAQVLEAVTVGNVFYGVLDYLVYRCNRFNLRLFHLTYANQNLNKFLIASIDIYIFTQFAFSHPNVDDALDKLEGVLFGDHS